MPIRRLHTQPSIVIHLFIRMSCNYVYNSLPTGPPSLVSRPTAPLLPAPFRAVYSRIRSPKSVNWSSGRLSPSHTVSIIVYLSYRSKKRAKPVLTPPAPASSATLPPTARCPSLPGLAPPSSSTSSPISPPSPSPPRVFSFSGDPSPPGPHSCTRGLRNKGSTAPSSSSPISPLPRPAPPRSYASRPKAARIS